MHAPNCTCETAPQTPEHTSCSLILCTKKLETSSGPRELRCRRNYGVPRNSLKRQFVSFSPPTSKSGIFLYGTLKKKNNNNNYNNNNNNNKRKMKVTMTKQSLHVQNRRRNQ